MPDTSNENAPTQTPDTWAGMASLGSMLRTIRLRAGLTQTALAARIGMSQPTVSQIEGAGQSTTTDVLERWAAECAAIITVTAGVDAELGAALLDLSPDDRRRLLRIAHAMPGIQADAVKESLTTTFEGIAAPR